MPSNDEGKDQAFEGIPTVRSIRGNCRSFLCEKIAAQLPAWRERVSRLLKEHGNFKVSDITVDAIYGGLRGVITQVSDISYVDPLEGIRIRGYTIPDLLQKLPLAPGSNYPLAGGLYFLLMANELPTMEEALLVEQEWKRREKILPYVYDVLDAMPEDTHPMTLFSIGILAMQNESQFMRLYDAGLVKEDYWEAYLDDSLNLTAKLPALAAYIYNKKYRNGQFIESDPQLDWSANFAHMIGKGDDPEFVDFSRLYFVLHCDHEGGNVSAHAAHLVATALSDNYYACSAGMNGLAGPLHGLANQECLRWLLRLRSAFDHFPTPQEVESYAWGVLKAGQVIPGYGHAVLRVTDPRFTALYQFAEKFFPEDEMFRLVALVNEVIPKVLAQHGKVKNPKPNVDAISGSLLYHYGIKEFDFYTVLFGVSRNLGLTTHNTWARALGKPIERPKSITTRMLEDLVAKSS